MCVWGGVCADGDASGSTPSRRLVLCNARAGEAIVREGDEAESWIILLDSGASVHKNVKFTAKRGQVIAHENHLAELDKFDSLGEAGIVDSAPRSSTVRVHDDCHYASLPADEYRALMLSEERVLAFEKLQKLRSVAQLASLSQTEMQVRQWTVAARLWAGKCRTLAWPSRFAGSNFPRYSTSFTREEAR